MINDLQGRNNLPESFEYKFILKNGKRSWISGCISGETDKDC